MFAIVAGLALAVGLFFVIPVLLTSLVKDRLGSAYLFWLVEGGVRTPVGLPAWWILLLTRILGVPLVAGLSFELIKFAGRNRGSGWVQPIIWPGMQLQKLTTREPDDEQVVVAIAALTAATAA